MRRDGLRYRLAVFAAMAALLGAACGDDGGGTEDVAGSSAVLPFAEVQASDFVFENDPGDPRRGIFRVTTTEPMICAVVWGETESLGNFNNSLAMNGTGIIDHDVFLPGALAGETYFYKVQGSTADGSLYESQLATFTLPPSDASNAPDLATGENLSLDATIVDVSSEFGEGWVAENAIDGDLTTEWSTSGDGSDGFLEIDLGSPQEIAGVEFLTRSMADGSAVTNQFTVTIDDDGSLGPFPAGNASDSRFAAVGATGQILRFDIVESTGGNTGAVEIRVVGG